jgi:hypothetical protein
MEWIPTLKYLLLGVHGVCGHAMSYQAVNATAS